MSRASNVLRSFLDRPYYALSLLAVEFFFVLPFLFGRSPVRSLWEWTAVASLLVLLLYKLSARQLERRGVSAKGKKKLSVHVPKGLVFANRVLFVLVCIGLGMAAAFTVLAVAQFLMVKPAGY